MNYYLDTEFLEGTQKKNTEKKYYVIVSIIYVALAIYHFYFANDLIKIGLIINTIFFACYTLFLAFKKYESEETIELISIGIVSEDGREFNKISKDFNIKEAWTRYQLKQVSGDARNRYPNGIKEYWIRENVLKPIFFELIELEQKYLNNQKRILGYSPTLKEDFTYKNFKRLVNKYGKTKEEIAKEIKEFTFVEEVFSERTYKNGFPVLPVQIYAYYADYDWVAFCWLFGKMNDLPRGFPMYCRDLQQILDEKQDLINSEFGKQLFRRVEKFNGYPVNKNEHTAIADARWNKELHEFLKSI